MCRCVVDGDGPRAFRRFLPTSVVTRRSTRRNRRRRGGRRARDEDDDENDDAVKKPTKPTTNPTTTCPYLDTIDAHALGDFDFEKSAPCPVPDQRVRVPDVQEVLRGTRTGDARVRARVGVVASPVHAVEGWEDVVSASIVSRHEVRGRAGTASSLRRIREVIEADVRGRVRQGDAGTTVDVASSVGWNGILGRVRRVEQSLRGVSRRADRPDRGFRRERGFTGTQSRSSVASRAVTARRLFGLGLFVIRRLVVADEEDLERDRL